MSETTTIHCLTEAISPITHMSGSQGNESIVAREPMMTPRGVRYVPYLSGNAIRHRMVREPGADWLVDALGLRGKLTLTQLNFLFHGGNLTAGGAIENTRRIADMQRLFPLFRLLGGTLPDQILAGNLIVHRGVLACRENQHHIEREHGAIGCQLRPAEQCVSGYQYTRGDGRKSHLGMMDDVSRETDSVNNMMIFAGQAVTRGSMFIHGFTVPHASALELGALLLSLQLWQINGGTIGGQSSRGHGRLAMAIVGDVNNHESLIEMYEAHVEANKDECVYWIEQNLSPIAKEKKPGKKTKAETADA